MVNDLTRKGEDFDFALDEPKKTIPLGETVRKAESGHISDATTCPMDNMHRDAYERERQFQRKHHMDNRRSGKSFRCILQALLSASRGARVAYVCDNHREAQYVFHQAMRVAGSYLDDFFEGQHNSPSCRIIFRNGGLIHFVDYDTHRHNCHTRGIDRTHEVIDDYNR